VPGGSIKNQENGAILLENYLIIPLRVEQADISADAIRLYGHILFLSQKEGYSFATNEYLAQRLKRKLTATKKYLSELEKIKFIRIAYPDNQDKSKRKIYPLVAITTKLGCAYPEKIFSSTYREDKENKNNNSLSDAYDLDKEIEEIINNRNKQ
jgi:hypothetical protein